MRNGIPINVKTFLNTNKLKELTRGDTYEDSYNEIEN